MSRCFPFPPPGYEKKPRPEEDLLKEEKRKEKKHKKEKKDKEKREGKDKKEKDKSDGKHKEKKDKKEKHRDKKEKHRDKKKDKSKDKEKNSISEDARIAGELETRGRDKVNSKEELPNNKSPIGNTFARESHGFDENRRASVFQVQNGQSSIGNSASVFQGQNGQNSIGNNASVFQGQNGQNSITNSVARESEESKFVQEFGKRIRDDGKAIGSQAVHRFPAANCRGYQEMHRSAVKDLQNLAEDKDRRIDDRKLDSEGLKDGPRSSGNTMVRGPAGSTDLKLEAAPGSAQKDSESIVEGKVKSKDRGDDKRGEKRKDKDKKEKKSHGKDKGREKEKKKEKVKERTEHKKSDQDWSKDVYMTEISGFNNSSSNISAVDKKIVSPEENVKKRTDVETNGFVHGENEPRPNKLPRLTSYQPMDNGRMFEACQTPGMLNSDRVGVTNRDRDKEDIKLRRVNGTIDAPSLTKSKQKPPLTTSDQLIEVSKKLPQADQVAEASRTFLQASQVKEASPRPPLAEKMVEASRRLARDLPVLEASKKQHRAVQVAEPSRKPPHPDLKHLSQVLSVPKMGEWSGVDDQEWLFSGKDPPLKKKQPDVSTGGDSRVPQLWSEALHIESADIYALPYVIPY